MSKENGYQESVISKTFKRIINKSKQQRQATCIHEEEIRMSINVLYVKGAGEKLQRILRSHKIRSTFCTESSLRKLVCKAKDRVATEDKNNIVDEIGSKNCEQSTPVNIKDL